MKVDIKRQKLAQDLPDAHQEIPLVTVYGYLHIQFESTQTLQSQVVAQIYDSCGFLTPILCGHNASYNFSGQKDKSVLFAPEHFKMWQTFINTLDCLKEVTIPHTLITTCAFCIDYMGLVMPHRICYCHIYQMSIK